MKDRNIVLEEIVIRGQNASALLNNPILKDAFAKLEAALEERELATFTTDTEACQDIIRTKQLLAGLQRNITTLLDSGKLAARELEMRRPKESILRKLVR